MSNRNSDYVFKLPGSDPSYTKDKTTEYPSHRITTRIRLNANNIPDDRSLKIMTEDLRKKNMHLSLSEDGNIITVSGYPPDTGFDQHKVLEIVQNYYKAAQLVPEDDGLPLN